MDVIPIFCHSRRRACTHSKIYLYGSGGKYKMEAEKYKYERKVDYYERGNY